jgi:hypothetical protein
MKKVKIQKHKLLLRHLTIDDYDNIAVLMEHVYGNLGGAPGNEISMLLKLPVFLKGRLSLRIMVS